MRRRIAGVRHSFDVDRHRAHEKNESDLFQSDDPGLALRA
jgi:hypothetical protein